MATTTMQPGGATGISDPRHTFLSFAEVCRRYGWGRSTGYAKVKQPGFPRRTGARYRLDLLMGWEDAVVTTRPLPEPAPAPVGEPARGCDPPVAPLGDLGDPATASAPTGARRRSRRAPAAEPGPAIPPRRQSRRGRAGEVRS